MSEQPKRSIETLADEAERRVSKPECPFCGGTHWEPGEDVAAVYYAGDLLIEGKPGQGFGVVPFACLGCGFIRFHSEQALRRLSEA